MPSIFRDCFVQSTANVKINTLSCVFPAVSTFINWLLIFVGLVVVVLIIYAGIRFTMSGGDAKKVEDNRKVIMYAILGLVLIFSSFMIVRFVSTATGVACIDPSQPLSFTTCGATAGGGAGTTCTLTSYQACISGNSCGTGMTLVTTDTCPSGSVCCNTLSNDCQQAGGTCRTGGCTSTESDQALSCGNIQNATCCKAQVNTCVTQGGTCYNKANTCDTGTELVTGGVCPGMNDYVCCKSTVKSCTDSNGDCIGSTATCNGNVLTGTDCSGTTPKCCVSAICSVNNPTGTCPTGQTCAYDDGGSYSCHNNCSATHTSGYCPAGKTCAYDVSLGWSCKNNCNSANPSGYCSGANNCTEVNGAYQCEPACDVAKNPSGYCSNPQQICTYDSYGGSWYCKNDTPCSINNTDGYCPYGQTCQYESGGQYSCQTAPCSLGYPNGKCPTGQSCRNTYGTTYACVNLCSSTYTNGYCPNGLTCTYDSNGGSWYCK